MEKPQRIQMKRKKGFNLQQYSKSLNGLECVVVSHPTKWGNPFKVGLEIPDYCFNFFTKIDILTYFTRGKIIETKKEAVMLYAKYIINSLIDEIPLLKGKNLSCWCKKNEHCHADMLLSIANSKKK